MSDVEDNTKTELKDGAPPEKSGEKAAGQDSAAEGDKGKSKVKSSSSKVRFNEKIEIDYASPYEKYNNGYVKAYKARAVKGSTPLFALVCDRALVPRHHRVDTYSGIVNQNMAPLADAGPVYWPPTKSEQYVLIYGDTMGERLVKPGGRAALGLKPDFVKEKILPPLIGVLQDFRDKDFVHGSICANNLFVTSDFKNVVLGDCLSTPSGYFQGLAYETLERAMTDPIARGVGTQASDLYAFGVMLSVLMRSSDPLEGMSDEEVIQYKYDVGSYVAITGKDRFTGSILELLRGLLNDNAEERWTIDEVLAWLDGRRLSPKQTMKKTVAARPLRLGGKKFFSPMLLAMEMGRHQTEVRRMVDEGEIKNWVVRSLEQPKLYDLVEAAIGQAGGMGQGPGYDERLATFLSITFDPNAPIRFKGANLMPDGVGSALAEAYVKKGNLNLFAEMFSQNIAMTWIRAQTNPNLDIAGLVKRFDSCRAYIKQSKIGFGLERCLYVVNPEAYCLSDKLKNYFVIYSDDVLFAYEDICSKGSAPSLFIDRHIAAFLAVKDSKVIENSMADLNSDEYYKQMLGNLKCFATLQRRSQLPPFPKIAQAFAEQMNVVYKRYHDRRVREALKKNVLTYAADGDLVKMSALMENPDVQKKDLSAFKKAMYEYSALRDELSKLKEKLESPKTFGVQTGQEIASIIACIISALVIVTIGFMYLSNKGVL